MYKNDTKKVKSNLQNGRDYFQYTYPTEDLYLEHTKSSYKSTSKIQLKRGMGISLLQELDQKGYSNGHRTFKRTHNIRKCKVEPQTK